jgi:hypothetical protein
MNSIMSSGYSDTRTSQAGKSCYDSEDDPPGRGRSVPRVVDSLFLQLIKLQAVATSD